MPRTDPLYVPTVLRPSEVAKENGISVREVVRLYRERPGVIRLPVRRAGKTRRLLLIPKSVLDEDVWTVADLASQFHMTVQEVVSVFSYEKGVIGAGEDLLIPESVRQRVFKKNTNE